FRSSSWKSRSSIACTTRSSCCWRHRRRRSSWQSLWMSRFASWSMFLFRRPLPCPRPLLRTGQHRRQSAQGLEESGRETLGGNLDNGARRGRPAPPSPLEEDLPQLGAQVLRRGALVAADLDQPLQADLELVVVLAGRAVSQVTLHLLE